MFQWIVNKNRKFASYWKDAKGFFLLFIRSKMALVLKKIFDGYHYLNEEISGEPKIESFILLLFANDQIEFVTSIVYSDWNNFMLKQWSVEFFFFH